MKLFANTSPHFCLKVVCNKGVFLGAYSSLFAQGPWQVLYLGNLSCWICN